MDGHTGPTTLTTILPSAVFGAGCSRERTSVPCRSFNADARPSRSASPRLGFYIVDVRDLADLHIRAMIAPEAAGQRFIAAGDFMWLAEIAGTLRSKLGDRASRVPTRAMPDVVVRFLSLFIPQLRMFTPDLGRKNRPSSDKAAARARLFRRVPRQRPSSTAPKA